MRRFVIPAVVLVLVACGGDSSGPGTNLTGNWLYSVSNLTTGGLRCSSSGTTLSITQSGSTFSGSYSGGTMTCTSASGASSFLIGTGTIISGSLSGNSVSFDLDSSDCHNVGTLTGSSISGTVTVLLTVDATNYTLTGNFGAARS